MQEKKKPTIQVDRRRKGGKETLGSQPRADEPQRQREERLAGSRRAASQTGTSTSSGSGLGRMPWWMAILVIIFFVAINLFSGGDSEISKEVELLF